MRVIEEEQLDLDDVSIMPKRSSLNSRSEVNLWRTFKWTSASGVKHELSCKPLMVANMATVGTKRMALSVIPRGYLCALEKHYSNDGIIQTYNELRRLANEDDVVPSIYTGKLAVSVGLRETLDQLVDLKSRNYVPNIINIDAPNGYCPNMSKRVKEVRELFPEAFIIAGVVVTGDIVSDLLMSGANCIRLGICCGSVCLTSQKTGVRRPIVSMLNECSDAAHNVKGYTMLDGGLRCPADWCKATIAGADLCMSGSIFAGTDEAEGDIIEKTYMTDEMHNDQHVMKVKKFKRYFGMSTDYAQEHYFGGVKKYRTSEGRQKLIPYAGSLDDVLRDYEGGMRSMMCFIGAKDFKSIQRHGTLYKVRHQINEKFDSYEDFA